MKEDLNSKTSESKSMMKGESLFSGRRGLKKALIVVLFFGAALWTACGGGGGGGDDDPARISNVQVSGTSGDILITFDLDTGSSPVCSVSVEYLGGSVGGSWTPASAAGNLVGLADGDNLESAWNSSTDEPDQTGNDFRVRLTPVCRPNDGPEESAVFSLDNTDLFRYWATSYGFSPDLEVAYETTEALDGGYLVVGSTETLAGEIKAWVIKLESSGTVVWQKTFGGLGDDAAFSVASCSDGGAVVAGSTDSGQGSGKDVLVIRLDVDGNVVWQRAFGDDGTGGDERANAIAQTSDGGFVFSADTTSFGAVSIDPWIVKLTADGDIEWQRRYQSLPEDHLLSIEETIDSGYVAGGWIIDNLSAQNFYVLKLLNNGDVDLRKGFRVDGQDIKGFSVRQTSDGGYIAAGSMTPVAGSGSDLLLLKLNTAGGVTWKYFYGGNGEEWAQGGDVVQTSDGGYALTGDADSFGQGGEDVWILKVDSNGSILWQKSYGGNNSDLAFSIIETIHGDLSVAGSTASFSLGSEEFWVLKVDSDNGGFDDPTLPTLDQTATASNKGGAFNVQEPFTTVSINNTSATVTDLSTVSTFEEQDTTADVSIQAP